MRRKPREWIKPKFIKTSYENTSRPNQKLKMNDFQSESIKLFHISKGVEWNSRNCYQLYMLFKNHDLIDQMIN